MKILILNPPKYNNQYFIREGRCMQTKSSWAALWPPLSLSYIAAFLRKTRFEVKLLDCIASDINFSLLKRVISEFRPALLVINSAFPTIYSDLKVATIAKNIDRQINTVLIGMVPTLLEDTIFKEYIDLDFLVVGEPEWAVKNLAETLDGIGEIKNIFGLMIQKNGTIIRNPQQNFLANNINELPFPARDLLDNSKYILPINGEKFTLLSVGRGCPYSCTFCIANIFYGKIFRKRPVVSVVDEIEECVNRFKINNFLFWGETFTLDKKYAISISDEIIKRKLRIKWATTCRADTIDSEMLSKMRASGCNMLSIGIESITDNILGIVKKGLSFDDIKKAIGVIKNAGIRAMGHFIFGLPFQTEKDCLDSIKFSIKSELDYAQFYCAVPYPKTELGKLASEKGWIKKDIRWSDYDLSKSIMSNGILRPEEITNFRNLAYRRFYLRPRMFLQAFKEINSLSSIVKISDFLKWIKTR
jgi:radical SAM superfamily enzyme YgiQ (UPF0313 family)